MRIIPLAALVAASLNLSAHAAVGVVPAPASVNVLEGVNGSVVFTITGNADDQSDALSLSAVAAHTGGDSFDTIAITGTANTCGFDAGIISPTYGKIPAAGCTMTVSYTTDPWQLEGFENKDVGTNTITVTATVTLGPGTSRTGTGVATINVADVPEPSAGMLALAGVAVLGTAGATRRRRARSA